MAPTSKSSQQTPAQIESDLAAVRARLVGSLEVFVDQVHPTRVKQRQLARLKRFATGKVQTAKAQVFDANGDLRKGRLGVAAGVVAAVATLLVLVRKFVGRRQR